LILIDHYTRTICFMQLRPFDLSSELQQYMMKQLLNII